MSGRSHSGAVSVQLRAARRSWGVGGPRGQRARGRAGWEQGAFPPSAAHPRAGTDSRTGPRRGVGVASECVRRESGPTRADAPSPRPSASGTKSRLLSSPVLAWRGREPVGVLVKRPREAQPPQAEITRGRARPRAPMSSGGDGGRSPAPQQWEPIPHPLRRRHRDRVQRPRGDHEDQRAPAAHAERRADVRHAGCPVRMRLRPRAPRPPAPCADGRRDRAAPEGGHQSQPGSSPGAQPGPPRQCPCSALTPSRASSLPRSPLGGVSVAA